MFAGQSAPRILWSFGLVRLSLSLSSQEMALTTEDISKLSGEVKSELRKLIIIYIYISLKIIEFHEDPKLDCLDFPFRDCMPNLHPESIHQVLNKPCVLSMAVGRSRKAPSQ